MNDPLNPLKTLKSMSLKEPHPTQLTIPITVLTHLTNWKLGILPGPPSQTDTPSNTLNHISDWCFLSVLAIQLKYHTLASISIARYCTFRGWDAGLGTVTPGWPAWVLPAPKEILYLASMGRFGLRLWRTIVHHVVQAFFSESFTRKDALNELVVCNKRFLVDICAAVTHHAAQVFMACDVHRCWFHDVHSFLDWKGRVDGGYAYGGFVTGSDEHWHAAQMLLLLSRMPGCGEEMKTKGEETKPMLA